MKYTIILLSIGVMLFTSCKTEKAKSTKTNNTCKLVVNKNRATEGDLILFNMESSDKPIKQITYSVDDVHVDYKDGYKVSGLSLGKHKLTGKVEFDDGTRCSKYIFLEIRSVVAPQEMKYELVNSYEHNNMSYTQGLEYIDGVMYEGTGQYGFSKLFTYQLNDLVVKQELKLDENDFGEGVTVMGDLIYQLTWHKGMAYVYDKKSFYKVNEFLYKGEGWGLTHNEEHLIMSNGTNKITFRDPETFQVEREIYVYDDKNAIGNLNELEYVDGFIYANIYQTNTIVKIEASSGAVVAHINFAGILNPKDIVSQIDVLNGIAYNPESKRFYITGKYWPKLFEVEFIAN